MCIYAYVPCSTGRPEGEGCSPADGRAERLGGYINPDLVNIGASIIIYTSFLFGGGLLITIIV